MADLQYSPMTVFQLLLNTATLEHDLTQIYKRLISEKVRARGPSYGLPRPVMLSAVASFDLLNDFDFKSHEKNVLFPDLWENSWDWKLYSIILWAFIFPSMMQKILILHFILSGKLVYRYLLYPHFFPKSLPTWKQRCHSYIISGGKLEQISYGG